MSFVVRKTKNRAWLVVVDQQLCDDDGKITEIKQTFVGQFGPFTEQEFEDLIDASEKEYPWPKPLATAPMPLPAETAEKIVLLPAKREAPPLSVTLSRNAYVFCRLMKGWGKEVVDEDKQPIPFSTAALTGMVTGQDGYAISGAINRALGEMRFGRASEKNLSASLAPGASSVPVEAETSSPATLPSSE